MVKVLQMTIPPLYAELLAKIASHFDQMIYPTWATRFYHGTRSAKKQNKEKTYIPTIASVWKTFSPTTKALWRSCALFMKQTGYQYFTSKYAYCRKNGLNLNITPTVLHQMHGLMISNLDGSEIVQAVRDDIVLTGQISVSFVYKKSERDVSPIEPFNLYIEAYYFEGGQNKKDIYLWEAPGGSIDWSNVSFSFGVTSRYYFHVVFIWTLFYYDADVFIDNLLLTDMYGDVYREAFKVKAGKSWVYTPHYRKSGWEFYPQYVPPFFEVKYLE